ncbi:MAG TPA: energy transducer TonB [Candidatus Eisenbacteria bacterium]
MRKPAPSLMPAQVTATEAPVPAAAPTPMPPPPQREAPAWATGRGIEGRYSVEGESTEISVRRLLVDVYHLQSSSGWEGVGILDGTIYRGVFRDRGAPDGGKTMMGEHVIDWSNPEAPSVHMTYLERSVSPLTQRWRRVSDAGWAVIEKPLPPAPPPSLHRPAYGEYVQVDELPEAVTKVAPTYPELNPNLDATVMLSALVLEDGTVGDVRVVKSVRMLDEAAIAAVRQWRFKPARAKGVPVAVWVAIPVRFKGQ